MADAAPSFASPVRGAAMGSADSVLLEDLTGARLTLVTGPGAVPPPVEVGFAARRGEAVVLSVSPSEVLLIGEEAVGVDVTHARILYRLTGPASALALERVCALDFDDRFMPEGLRAARRWPRSCASWLASTATGVRRTCSARGDRSAPTYGMRWWMRRPSFSTGPGEARRVVPGIEDNVHLYSETGKRSLDYTVAGVQMLNRLGGPTRSRRGRSSCLSS